MDLSQGPEGECYFRGAWPANRVMCSRLQPVGTWKQDESCSVSLLSLGLLGLWRIFIFQRAGLCCMSSRTCKSQHFQTRCKPRCRALSRRNLLLESLLVSLYIHVRMRTCRCIRVCECAYMGTCVGMIWKVSKSSKACLRDALEGAPRPTEAQAKGEGGRLPTRPIEALVGGHSLQRAVGLLLSETPKKKQASQNICSPPAKESKLQTFVEAMKVQSSRVGLESTVGKLLPQNL